MNQLYRSNTNKAISGVCGGIGEYLSISPDIVRALFVIATLMTGLGFIAYIAATILIPQAPVGYNSHNQNPNNNFSFENIKNKNVIGMVLIGLGVVLTLKKLIRIDDMMITSVILIAVGIYIIIKGGKNK